jgi:Lon protease-like protein
VSTWDRTNRLELELMQRDQQLRDARNNDLIMMAGIMAERDRARATACALEAECAELVRHVEHLTATLDDIVMVPVIGDAS